MVRRLLIFLVLAVHINGSMFMPQGAEQDVYDAHGYQLKDVDTVIEYIDEMWLDKHDKDPVDKDNDQGQNFHLVKMVDYYYVPDLTPVKHKFSTSNAGQRFATVPDDNIPAVTLDILAPPPKA